MIYHENFESLTKTKENIQSEFKNPYFKVGKFSATNNIYSTYNFLP